MGRITTRKDCILPAMLLILALLSAAAFAAGTVADQSFSSGVALFKQGRYAAARTAFEKARAAGMDTPVLYYDLGTTNFKMGDLEAARSDFLHIITDPSYGQYARYNLGLIARQQGDSKTAHRYFSHVADNASDPSLRKLAQTQLEKLGNPKGPGAVGFLDLESGYDTNVILRRTASAVTPSQRGSPVYGLLTGGAALLQGSWNHGLQLTGSMFYRAYSSVSGYNQLLLQGGPKYRFPIGGWTVDTIANAAYFRFGSATLETLYGLRMRASHGMGSDGTVTLHGSLFGARGGSNYGYLDGNFYSAGIRTKWELNAVTFSIGYDHRVDRREGLQSGNEFFSVSPTSDRLSTSLDWHFAKGWETGLHAHYEHSRYREPDVYTVNGTLVTVQRVDNDTGVGMSLSRDFSPSVSLQLSAEHDNNGSTVPRYSYAQNLYLLRLRFLF